MNFFCVFTLKSIKVKKFFKLIEQIYFQLSRFLLFEIVEIDGETRQQATKNYRYK
jgi:hypothetical protein